MSEQPITDNKLAEVKRGQTILENTPIVGQTSVAQIIELAKIMAASGLFPDAKTAQQASGLMLIGQQFGLTPIQALTGIHIVKGKPMLHYSVILARVRQHPDYDYRVAEHTDKVCTVEFLRRGEPIGVSTFTAEDARKAGTQNMDKLAKTMLLARAASQGVKWYAPDVLNGLPVYTDGEIEQSAIINDGTSITDKIRAAIQKPTTEPPKEPTPDAFDDSEIAEYADVDPDGVLIMDDMP